MNMKAQKLCLKSLGQTISVIDVGEGETVWKFNDKVCPLPLRWRRE